MKLYHLKGKKRYLDTARFFIEEQGKGYAGGDKYRKEQKTKPESLEITAIPYFAWANRESGKMLVWIPTDL